LNAAAAAPEAAVAARAPAGAAAELSWDCGGSPRYLTIAHGLAENEDFLQMLPPPLLRGRLPPAAGLSSVPRC